MAFSAVINFAIGGAALNLVDSKTEDLLDDASEKVAADARSRAHVLTGKNRASIHRQTPSKKTRLVATESGYGGYEELRGGDHAYMRPSLFEVQTEIKSG